MKPPTTHRTNLSSAACLALPCAAARAAPWAHLPGDTVAPTPVKQTNRTPNKQIMPPSAAPAGPPSHPGRPLFRHDGPALRAGLRLGRPAPEHLRDLLGRTGQHRKGQGRVTPGAPTSHRRAWPQGRVASPRCQPFVASAAVCSCGPAAAAAGGGLEVGFRAPAARWGLRGRATPGRVVTVRITARNERFEGRSAANPSCCVAFFPRGVWGRLAGASSVGHVRCVQRLCSFSTPL